MNTIFILMFIISLFSWLFSLLFAIYIALLLAIMEGVITWYFFPLVLWFIIFLLLLNYIFNKKLFKSKKYNYKFCLFFPFSWIRVLLEKYWLSNKYIFIYALYYFSLIMFCSLLIYQFFLGIMSFEPNLIPYSIIWPTLMLYPVLFFMLLFIKIKLYNKMINDLWLSKMHLIWLILLESFYYPFLIRKNNI